MSYTTDRLAECQTETERENVRAMIRMESKEGEGSTTLEALQMTAKAFSDPKSPLDRTNHQKRCASAIRFLRKLSKHAFDIVKADADKCEHHATSFGHTTAYLNGVQLGDAWKGRHVPASILAMDIVFLIVESEKQRAEIA